MLVEYIEAIVPVFYIIYLEFLFQLPNALYYPEMQTMTVERLSHLEHNIAIYAIVDVLSLVCMQSVLKWRLNLSPFHLLTFTLETERAILQSTFIAWVISMQFTIAHYGKDSVYLS